LTSMRITAELIRTTGSYINPLREREISLRGYKIGSIENLGVTQDQYDVIDMSENEIVTVDNFPLLRTLHTLVLSNNRVRIFAPKLGQYLPNLRRVVLFNNRVSELEELDPLADVPTITDLVLIGNPVVKKDNYRLYCIHLFPRLRVLDFGKIKPRERKESERIFGKAQQRKIAIAEEKKTEAPIVTSGPTPQQKQRIMDMIAAATSLEEISNLEKMLETGVIPQDL